MTESWKGSVAVWFFPRHYIRLRRNERWRKLRLCRKTYPPDGNHTIPGTESYTDSLRKTCWWFHHCFPVSFFLKWTPSILGHCHSVKVSPIDELPNLSYADGFHSDLFCRCSLFTVNTDTKITKKCAHSWPWELFYTTCNYNSLFSDINSSDKQLPGIYIVLREYEM